MYLFYRRGLELDGARPTLLTGYGDFNLSLPAAYSPSARIPTSAPTAYSTYGLARFIRHGARSPSPQRKIRTSNI